MTTMDKPVSIAIETSSRAGGVALGFGDKLSRVLNFDTSVRHATQLVQRLAVLLDQAAVAPADLDELYVSVGPGSYTGLRVGITVARTMAQALTDLRCVGVPAAWAVAEGARKLPWENLGVVTAAKDGTVYGTVFRRDGERIIQAGEPGVQHIEQFLARAPRPLMLIGEALGYCDLDAKGVELAAPTDCDLHLPTAAAVWSVGRQLGSGGRFTQAEHLLPIYSRRPEAIRLWQRRHGGEK